MTAAAFASLLERDGITVAGSPATATASASAPLLASVSSPTVAAIAEQMLLESNNVIAENLARHVAIALGMPATFSGAADAVMTEARRLGVTTPDHLVDGSGLSPDDGIAPETLVRVLALAASRPQLRAVITGLPVAGFAGTLSVGRQRFRRDRRAWPTAPRAGWCGPRPGTCPRSPRWPGSPTTATAGC